MPAVRPVCVEVVGQRVPWQDPEHPNPDGSVQNPVVVLVAFPKDRLFHAYFDPTGKYADGATALCADQLLRQAIELFDTTHSGAIWNIVLATFSPLLGCPATFKDLTSS